MGCKLSHKSMQNSAFVSQEACVRGLSHLKKKKEVNVSHVSSLSVSHNLPFPKGFPEMCSFYWFTEVRSQHLVKPNRNSTTDKEDSSVAPFLLLLLHRIFPPLPLFQLQYSWLLVPITELVTFNFFLQEKENYFYACIYRE